MPTFLNNTTESLGYYPSGDASSARSAAPGQVYESDYESMHAGPMTSGVYVWVRVLLPVDDVAQEVDPAIPPLQGLGDWRDLFYSRTYGRLVLGQDMQNPLSQYRIYQSRPLPGGPPTYYRRFPDGGRVYVSLQGLTVPQVRTLQQYYTANPDGSLDIGREYISHLSTQPDYSYNYDGEGVPAMPTTPVAATTPSPVPAPPPPALTEEQRKSRAVMDQLVATKSLKQAESLIQCGIEFEFHALNGKERGQFEGSLDEGRLSEAVEEWIRVNIDSAGSSSPGFLKYLVGNRPWPSNSRLGILKPILLAGLNYESALAPGDLLTNIRNDVELMRGSYLSEVRRDLLSGPNRATYITDIGIVGWDRISSYTQLGDDGSVRGGEIRTVGPRSIPEVLAACRVLSENDFLVAENTSLHIHMSVRGIKHAYGKRFQAEMYAYLLRNLHRMPDSVRKRIVHARGCQAYAKLLLSTEKYSAIHFHKHLGTWEFRLFGNTRDYKEMRTCLQLAYEALKHAYTVKADPNKSLLGRITNDRIQQTLEKLMANPEKFWETLDADTTIRIETEAA